MRAKAKMHERTQQPATPRGSWVATVTSALDKIWPLNLSPKNIVDMSFQSIYTAYGFARTHYDGLVEQVQLSYESISDNAVILRTGTAFAYGKSQWLEMMTVPRYLMEKTSEQTSAIFMNYTGFNVKTVIWGIRDSLESIYTNLTWDSSTYGTSGNGVQDKPAKDRTVSFNESPGVGQDTLGSPADEASEAMPLLDGLDTTPADEQSTLPEGGEPAITVTPDTTENPIVDTEHKEDVSKEVIEPVPSPTSPKERPTSMTSITSDSSTGENLGSPTGDFVFSPEGATPEGEKKSKKSVGKKLKKGFGKFSRRKRGSSGTSDSGVSTSETSLVSAKSGSTLDAPK